MNQDEMPSCDPDEVAAWPVPLQWRRVFPGQAAQLRPMRSWMESLLPDCPARDDAVAVANELAGNAVRHTASKDPGNTFLTVVSWREQAVRIAVADGGATTAPRMISDPEGEDGRGLIMVAALSVRTGVSGDERGRVVWADIPWAGDGPPLFPDGLRAAICEGRAMLQQRFPGAATWWGMQTMQWWAMTSHSGVTSLVSAQSPAELAQKLTRQPRGSPTARHVPQLRKCRPAAGKPASSVVS
jgi:anti-sigma regulatory factor (Ser/Thr protein kinase)